MDSPLASLVDAPFCIPVNCGISHMLLLADFKADVVRTNAVAKYSYVVTLHERMLRLADTPAINL